MQKREDRLCKMDPNSNSMSLPQFLNYIDYNYSCNYPSVSSNHHYGDYSTSVAYGGFFGRSTPQSSENYHQGGQINQFPWNGCSSWSVSVPWGVPQNSYQNDSLMNIENKSDCAKIDCDENDLPTILPQVASPKRRRSYDGDNADVDMEYDALLNYDDTPMSVITKAEPTIRKKPRTKKSTNARLSHNTRERKRHDKLSEAFGTLQSLIPHSSTERCSQFETLKLSAM